MHGGITGFDKKYWTVDDYNPSERVVVFSLISKSGEEGYPGEIKTTIAYKLSLSGDLSIDYRTEWTDSPDNQNLQETVVNLTNHSYFNLSGFSVPTITGHLCSMPGVQGYLELDANQIPTGSLIENSQAYPSMDFSTHVESTEGSIIPRGPKTFGQGLPDVTQFRGYDHFFVSNKETKGLNSLVKVGCTETGISMELLSDALGFQLYTGNWLDGSISAKKTQSGVYGQYSGFCLEASSPPDSLNHSKWQNLVILKKGDIQTRRDVYHFEM